MFARALRLKSMAEWRLYIDNGDKPEDIPAQPNVVYKGKGWISWGDWLGTGNISNQLRKHRDFKEAKVFVQGLKLKSLAEWVAYAKSDNKPKDIPASPSAAYKDKGWISVGDWLGTGSTAPNKRQFRDFNKAKELVKELGLNSKREWRTYAVSTNRPKDIPSHPNLVYKNKGWVSWGDWLGKLTN